MPRTRNLAASNKDIAEFLSGRCWPNIMPVNVGVGVGVGGVGVGVGVVVFKVQIDLVIVCAHSELWKNTMAGICL